MPRKSCEPGENELQQLRQNVTTPRGSTQGFANVRRLSRFLGAVVLLGVAAMSLLLAFSLYSHRSDLRSVDPLMVVAVLLAAAAVSGFGGIVLILGVLRD